MYTGDTESGGITPRATIVSMMTLARLPPREWPVKATVAKGEVARCCWTRGSRESYSWRAACRHKVQSDDHAFTIDMHCR